MTPTERVVLIQPKRTFKRLPAWHTSALVIRTWGNEKKQSQSGNTLYFENTSLPTALSTNLFFIAKLSTSMERVSSAAHLTAVRQPQNSRDLSLSRLSLFAGRAESHLAQMEVHKESSTAPVTSGTSPKCACPHSQQLWALFMSVQCTRSILNWE